ncbi:methylated-DNA--protein-cysteine methyltransferase isoform 5 [Mus musculus]|uniref:methylated-DNA--protein-cysteine methyltransferase isoform 5 n=1 Tax=Mus musculus TaxID=10090 RepID=UPI0021DF418E|nr:methylated-DNA--protein-cysteine methyltransferase isoform 5 [Mus musculus]
MAETCKMKYSVLDSPLGKMELSGCERGLHGIRLLSGKTPNTDPTEAPATPEVLGGPEGVPEPLVQCTAWLEAYFREPAATEGLPLPALHHPVFQQDSFTRQVLWKLLKVVKFGETVSYQQLAALAGNPKAARAVGGAMRSNPSLLSTGFPAYKKTMLLDTPYRSTNAVGILAQPRASTAKGETKALLACGKSCHHTVLGESTLPPGSLNVRSSLPCGSICVLSC